MGTTPQFMKTLIFVLVALVTLSATFPTHDSLVPETEEYGFHINHHAIAAARANERARKKNNCHNYPNLRDAPASAFPCYARSKVSWENKKFGDYMLNGPIREAITKIPGLTAYVCPTHQNGIRLKKTSLKMAE